MLLENISLVLFAGPGYKEGDIKDEKLAELVEALRSLRRLIKESRHDNTDL